MGKVNELLKQRQALQKRAEIDLKVAAAYDEGTPSGKITVALQEAEAMSKLLDENLWLVIEASAEDEDVEDAARIHAEINAVIMDMKAHLVQLSTPAVVEKKVEASTEGSNRSSVRLPKLELPTFDGKYEDWVSFKDLFTASVIENKSLSDSQRLQYLKAQLKGEPLGLVSSVAVTDGNWHTAWDKIKERYENARLIISSHISKLINQKCVNNESVSGVRKLLDTTHECISALDVMGVPVSYWDDFLVVFLVEKLDAETRKQWSLHNTSKLMPSFNELSEFVENYIRALKASSSKHATQGSSAAASSHGKERKEAAAHFVSGAEKCPICSDTHPVYKCPKFLQANVTERDILAKKHHLCFNCLGVSHGASTCKVTSGCKLCSKRHHTLLHFQSKVEQEKPKDHKEHKDKDTKWVQHQQPKAAVQDGMKPAAHVASPSLTCHSVLHSVLLCTAVVRVKDKWGSFQFCRVLINQGSQLSFVSDSCRARLGFGRERSQVTGVTGVQSVSFGKPKGQVELQLFSCYSEFHVSVTCVIFDKVTGQLPNFKYDQVDWEHLRGLDLADPLYHVPRDVDILLGADVYNDIILSGRKMGPAFAPTAQQSEFGWVLSGRVSSVFAGAALSHHSMAQVEENLQRFWELEQVPFHAQATAEERKAEEHFVQHIKREDNGRFRVSVPYNSNLAQLGSSRNLAMRRFLQIEKRLSASPENAKEYGKFMNEYLSLKHMLPVPYKECGETLGVTNYLPHHFVIKEDSTTTKMRVVFDASMKTTSGISLNNCQLIGPTIQDDLFSILLRFRFNAIALKADVSKMYRQFLVPKSDQDMQRILWRELPTDPIREYRLRTVTYGTASAPFLATRCLQQLALDEKHLHPRGAKAVLKDFYVDDFLGGASSVDEARTIVDELDQLMGKGCLELRKWDSSHPEVIAHLPSHFKESKVVNFVDKSALSKALGIVWNSSTDHFSFAGYESRLHEVVTKRTVLSEMSRVFDPLGWLSPLTVSIKIYFQQLWKPVTDDKGSHCVTWDEPIPENLLKQWTDYHEGLKIIKGINLNRFVLSANFTKLEIHGFSDASEEAYSAAVYVKSWGSGDTIHSALLVGKTKVSPLKFVSIPRLELCGALLLTRLIAAVTSATGVNCPIYAWTDSELVLRWLSTSSRRWSTFVANRVAEIQEVLPSETWHYVPSEQNPADCASRGLIASDLANFDLWWNGPSWLRESAVPSFQCEGKTFGDELEVKRKVTFALHVTAIDTSILSKFSKLGKLKKVVAYARRFFKNCRSHKGQRLTGPLTVTELQDAWLTCVKLAQGEDFSSEIERLAENRPVRVDSRTASIGPYLDKKGLLRVGGRLQKSNLPEHTKHQLVLMGKHLLTKLLIEHVHFVQFHAGFRLIWSTLLREHWVIGARNAIKQVIRNCVICRRHKGVTLRHLMGSYPSPRVTPSRPFMHTGVDYAGPFTLRALKGRGKLTFKGYMCVFVCFSTKAVHLEAVTEGTSEAFIATLKRFIARRGIPGHLYSDCGTNFVGADKQLKEFVSVCGTAHFVCSFAVNQGTEWHFNPPGAPHQGGLWEAAVKSTKSHLKRVIGDTTLTLEEFGTLLCQIEAILNSRPLCALSSEPSDMNVLTPGHFLVGEPLTAHPEPTLLLTKINRLSRWEHCQQMTQHFWKRWSQEYLVALQERFKWKRQGDNVKKGDLVLVKEDNVPSMNWRRARIVEIHPGADGIIRVVTLKTATGEFQRPVVKLVPLISAEE